MIANKLNSILYINALLFSLFVVALLSCVKEYWPDLKGDADNLLVVDGKITNDAPPYTIKLSRTTSVQNPEFIPVTDATVHIIDQSGIEEFCFEISPGIYQTSQSGMQGVVGNKYKLFIQTSSGVTYESDMEELLCPVGISSVTFKDEIKYVENAPDQQQRGYQFYVNTDMAASNKNYFYWEMEETYEYHSAYDIIFYYNGFFVAPDQDHPLGLPRTVDHDTLYFCWKTDRLKERYSYSTEYLTVPIIVDYALHFIPFNDERLQQKYSVLVKQYRISAKAYKFMKALEEQNSNQGGLISSQPFQVRGNMHCKSDPEEAVLGYFMPAGVASGERLFVKAPYYYHLKCGADTVTYNIVRYIQNASPEAWPLYFTYVYFPNPDPMGEAIEALGLINKDCLDCTMKGGVAVKPDFWE